MANELKFEPILPYLNSSIQFGAWRSPVAHSAGGRGVAGSNPVAPTLKGIFVFES